MSGTTWYRVSDEVWASAPRQRLPRWQVMTTLLLVCLVAAGAWWLSRSGLTGPALALDESGAYGYSTNPPRQGYYGTTLTNTGRTEVTITSMSVPASTGVTVSRVTWPDAARADQDSAGPPLLPQTLPPGGSVTFWIVLVPSAPCGTPVTGGPLVVDVTGPWGERSQELDVQVLGTDRQPWPLQVQQGMCSTPPTSG